MMKMVVTSTFAVKLFNRYKKHSSFASATPHFQEKLSNNDRALQPLGKSKLLNRAFESWTQVI